MQLDKRTQNTPMMPNPAKSVSENCLPIGTHLAEFEITDIIGEGGFGTVYLAFDHALQRTVAIKEYMPSVLASRGADKSVLVRSQRHQETFDAGLKSFINEARLLAQFDHPALIKVFRFWEENKTGYIAMRYYEGQTLKNTVKDNPGIVEAAWLESVMQPILEALEALHKVQILHRDISPDNIMIQKEGGAVLLDFGAARQVIGDMTQALTVILKPGYAPVEQYADDALMKQGPWTDIYALSAVIYSIIVKKPPATSVARMIKDPVEPLQSSMYPGFSQEFLSAINKGFSVKPEDRPQSVEEFRNLLGLGSSAPVAVPSILGPSDGRAKKNTNPAMIAAGLDRHHPDLKPSSSVDKKSTSARRSWARLTIAIFLAAGFGAGAYFFFNSPALDTTATTAPDVAGSASNSASVPVKPVVDVTQLPAQSTVDEETVAWEALNNNNSITSAELTLFIQKFPLGKYTGEARRRLAEIEAGKTPVNNTAANTGITVVTAPVDTLPQKDTPKKIETGIVTLAVNPWGTVLVDGASKGASPPLRRLVLPEGTHKIRIINPNFSNDYETEIEINKKNSVKIKYDFSHPVK